MIIIKKIIILLITILLIFIYKNIVFTSILDGVYLWLNSIFPSLFPFFIISKFLINYNFVYYASIVFKPLMKLFKINNNCAYIFVLSMLSGFPSSSKYTIELYDKGLISLNDCNKVLTFTHFANPLFIIGITSVIDIRLSYIVLFSHYITNIIIALINRNYHPSYDNFKNYKIESKKFSIIFSDSIKDTINTLLLILGTIVTFKIISSLITSLFNFNPLVNSLIKGILEMTQGINSIINLDISNKIKGTLITFLLSFGGISVHLQVLSIISEADIKYKPYLLSRILHSIISSIIFYLIY